VSEKSNELRKDSKAVTQRLIQGIK